MQTIKTVKTAWFLSMLLCLGLASAQAQTITKADNTNELSSGNAWVGSSAPTSANVAAWDSTIVNYPTNVLVGA